MVVRPTSVATVREEIAGPKPQTREKSTNSCDFPKTLAAKVDFSLPPTNDNDRLSLFLIACVRFPSSRREVIEPGAVEEKKRGSRFSRNQFPKFAVARTYYVRRRRTSYVFPEVTTTPIRRFFSYFPLCDTVFALLLRRNFLAKRFGRRIPCLEMAS